MINYKVVQQSSAGTVEVAAAVAGMKHKVLSCVLSPIGGGISTVRFTDAVGDLMGAYRVPGGSASGLVWPGPTILVETRVGSPLRVVSTGDGYAGVVAYFTEA